MCPRVFHLMEDDDARNLCSCVGIYPARRISTDCIWFAHAHCVIRGIRCASRRLEKRAIPRVYSEIQPEAGNLTPLRVLIEEAKKNDPAISVAESAAKAATFGASQMSTLPDLNSRYDNSE